MSTIVIRPEDGIWSSATQARIRESRAGDVIKLVGNFTGDSRLTGQFQLLGGASRLDLSQARVEVHTEGTATACFLLRNKRGQSVVVHGGTITYSASAATATHPFAVLYFLDCENVRVQDVSLDCSNANARVHGIVVEARTANTAYAALGGVSVSMNATALTSHHNAIYLRSKLVFANGTTNQRDSTKAGTIAGPDPAAHIQRAQAQYCTVSGGYYGFGLSGIASGYLTNCVTTNNTRGFSIQDKCNGIYVVNCLVYGNRSAGIHLAYGTQNCNITNCLVNGGRGEALYQAYVGTDNNAFHGCVGFSQNNATHAFQGSLGGRMTVQHCAGYVEAPAKALIGAESSWDPTLAQQWHSRSNAPVEAATGLEQPSLSNSVTVSRSTLVAGVAGSLASVVSDVKGSGQNSTLTISGNCTLSVPGPEFSIGVGPDPSKVSNSALAYGLSTSVRPQTFGVTKRVGSKYVTPHAEIQGKWSLGADDGSTAPEPEVPNPGTGTIDYTGTLRDGTSTKQLVAFVTRPASSPQYGDWIAFMEVHNGEVTTWPESVKVPQWSGNRRFPAVVLPANGQIESPFPTLTRTSVVLNGEDFLAQHPTVSGVQWYNRGAGLVIDNPNPAKERTTSGSRDIRITPKPDIEPGTVGESSPSGYTTFVWVKGTGSTPDMQFVTIRDSVPVPNPGHAAFTKSITFTSPKGFPAIVWPGNRLPADKHLRQLSRSYVTVPVSESGKTGVFQVAASAVANMSKAQLVSNGVRGDLQDSAVTAWFGEGTVVPDPGAGGGTFPFSPKVITRSSDMLEAAIDSMTEGHEVQYPGWVAPAAGLHPTNGAQRRGGAITMGGCFVPNQTTGVFRSSLFDSGFTQEEWDTVVNKPADTLQLWGCLMPGYSGADAWVEIRGQEAWALVKGENVWRPIFRSIQPAITWASEQGPSMSPYNGDELEALGRSGPPTLPHPTLAGGVSRTKTPSNVQLNNHFGQDDHPLSGRIDKSLDLTKVEGVLGICQIRLAPGSEGKTVGLQMGFDPKWSDINPTRRGGYWPGMMLSKLRRAETEWRTVAVVNSSSGLDAGRGGVVITPERIMATRIPAYT